MRTLLISDLHLGAPQGGDVLCAAGNRAPLLRRLADVDRLVILGDGLELRHGALLVALERAAPALRDIGAAMAGREIVYVTGNHDWPILHPWLAARRELDQPLALDTRTGPDDAGPVARRVADALAPADVTFAYPGLWVRDDVYALHGAYCDLHSTVPTFERIAAGTVQRALGVTLRTPDDYEAALAPLYAFIHESSQARGRSISYAASGTSSGVWRRLGRRHPSAALLWAGIAAAVVVLNRFVGPFSLDLSPHGLRRGGLHGIATALDNLGVQARWAIWGHSHRSGPWPGDDPAEWRTPRGTAIVNAGCWVYGPEFVTQRPNESPYWPGVAVSLDGDGGPPVLERLLGYRGHRELNTRRPHRA